MARLGGSTQVGLVLAARALLAVLTVVGCGDDDGGAPDAAAQQDGGAGDGSTMDGSMMDSSTPGECVAPQPNQPPDLLSCTGLYSDIVSKAVATGVREFKPAVELWSDGAVKRRWIYLPPNTTIDISNPDAWTFPIGTKFFKEFIWKGARIETRLFWKVSANLWVRTAYKWNGAETEATRTGGEDLDLDGDAYHIPSTTECDQCHAGRSDRSLGFEAVLLGLPGATGVTLSDLDDEGLLTGGSVPSTVAIADDGTGYGADALGWLHVNCGVSCHNGNPGANAYSTHMRLRLSVADADGSPTTGVDAITTTVGQSTVVGRWMPGVRIIAGDPDDSWLFKLMSERDPVSMRDQMPPIASRIVPAEAVTLLRNWINAMGGSPGADAGL